jgi:uncharacterized membrane protein
MSTVMRSVYIIRQSALGEARVTRLSRLSLWVSGAFAFVSAVAAAATFFVPGVLRGPAVMNGSARGTALVAVVIAVPTLLTSMRFASQSSIRALVTWLGSIVYLVYNSFLFLFMSPFNRLFLVYVAMLSLGLWSAATLVSQIDLGPFRDRFSTKLPRRALATYALVVVGLNTVAWLATVLPATFAAGEPAFLVGTGVTTSVLYAWTWRSGCRSRQLPRSGSGREGRGASWSGARC